MPTIEQTRPDGVDVTVDVAAEADVVATPAPPTTPPARRPIRRSTKFGVALVVVLSLLEITGFATHYLLVSSRFVTTDNATIDGKATDVVAPVSGVLARWDVQDGEYVRDRQPLGRIRVGGSDGPQKVVRASGEGRVARSRVTDGEWVTAGRRLATTFDGAGLYVTARVPEEEIADVRVGAPVGISVDALPGRELPGMVTEIQMGTASRFTVYPNLEDDPSSPDRTDEWVAVRVAFLDTGTFEPRPGMSVTAHIHRD